MRSPASLAAAVAALLLVCLERSSLDGAPGARAAVATAMTVAAATAAWLLRTRCVSSRRMNDLLLFAGVTTVALAQAGSGLVPALAGVPAPRSLAAADLWSSLLAGGMLVASTCVPSRVLVLGFRRPLATAALAAVGAGMLAQCSGWLLQVPLIGRTGGGGPLSDPAAHPLAVVVAVTATALLGLGGHRLAGHDAEVQDGAPIGAALVLLAGSVFYVLVLGPAPAGRFAAGYVADSLALCLILFAAIGHERRSRAARARAATLAERSRMARDLHDGLAQDLAVIAAHLPGLSDHHGEEHPVVQAARRALALTREAISELSDPAAVTCSDALHTMAEELRARFRIAIAVDVQLDPRPGSTACEHLSRIAREAVVNAVRHGGARQVVVSLRREGDGDVLRIADDGRGLARTDGAVPPDGFGLRSIRERSAALGARLSIRQPRRGGVVVEVVL